jgi:hypothetical protein
MESTQLLQRKEPDKDKDSSDDALSSPAPPAQDEETAAAGADKAASAVFMTDEVDSADEPIGATDGVTDSAHAEPGSQRFPTSVDNNRAVLFWLHDQM